jgi:hypothetical protein
MILTFGNGPGFGNKGVLFGWTGYMQKKNTRKAICHY